MSAEWTVRFWGVRGSIPSPGPDTARTGGNTSCVEARVGDEILIFDCGTGIRPLGLSLMKEFQDKPISASIMIGHTHWDHIQGFPFFVPAYNPKNTFRVYSVYGVARSFEKIFREQMGQNYFPVETGDMAAKLEFHQVNGPFKIGTLDVETTFSNHPGVNLAYRVRRNGKSIVYLTDHERFQAQVQKADDFSKRQDKVIEDFCRGADLLICDAQYNDDDYKLKRGWGHSRWRDTVELAVASGVKKLALFHHEPVRTDAEIDQVETACRALLKEKGSSIECVAAREGQSLAV